MEIKWVGQMKRSGPQDMGTRLKQKLKVECIANTM